MFYQGSHKVTLDAKSRIAVPTDFRKPLGDQCGGKLTLTRGGSKDCLWLFPRPVWLQFRQSLRKLRGQEMRWRSHFVQNARDVDLDLAGRLVIPSSLRELAGLNGSALYFAGDGDYFELWDWEARAEADSGMDYDQMPEALFDYDGEASSGAIDA